jgi:hypothetical protein
MVFPPQKSGKKDNWFVFIMIYQISIYNIKKYRSRPLIMHEKATGLILARKSVNLDLF